MIITSNQRMLLLLAKFCCLFLTTAAQSSFQAVKSYGAEQDNYIDSISAETHWGTKAKPNTTSQIVLENENFSPPDSACLPVVDITISQNDICGGTTVTFHATATNGGTNPKFYWKKNGVNPRVIDNPYYTSSDFHDGDVVVCEYSCTTACGVDTTVVSNAIILHIINDVTPTITVSNSDTLICEGNLTVFTATAFYGDWTPSYQWLVNGSPVGTDSHTFTTSTITNGSKVECVITISSPSCPGITKKASSQLTIYVYPLIHPAITITPSKEDICRGEAVTFTAKANGGAYPSFTWMINGAQTGPNAPSLTVGSLNDGDTITAIVTIDQDSRCHTTTSAGSNKVVIHVHDFREPDVTIAASVLDVCEGTPINFTATPNNAGSLVSYKWYVNDIIKGNDSPFFSDNQFSNGDKVFCLMTTNIPGCPIFRSVPSDTEAVIIRTLPVVSFSPPEIAIMSGESAQLQASVSGNTASFAWQPSGVLLDAQSLSPTTIPLLQDTTLQLSVVDENGCEAANKIRIKVLHKLYMPSAFTPNKDGKNDVFRIPPGSSLELREFLIFNRWGNLVFRTTDIAKGWNGTYKGTVSDAGVYVYLIKGSVLGQKVTVKGIITLVR